MSYARQRRHHRVAAKEISAKPVIEANIMTGKNNQRTLIVTLILCSITVALQLTMLFVAALKNRG